MDLESDKEDFKELVITQNEKITTEEMIGTTEGATYKISARSEIS